jgi:hypothetical protein
MAKFAVRRFRLGWRVVQFVDPLVCQLGRLPYEERWPKSHCLPMSSEWRNCRVISIPALPASDPQGKNNLTFHAAEMRHRDGA